MTLVPGPASGRLLLSALAQITRRWALYGALLGAGAAAPAAATTYAELQPVFQQRCVMCHGSASPAAGLSLDSLAGVLKGSARGPVVVAGQPAASELVKRLKGQSQPRMPLTGPPWLGDADVARLEAWIVAGMPAGAPIRPAAAETSALRPLPGPGEAVTWRHVAPIFATRCAKCHSPQGQMGPAPEGYLLNSYEGAISTQDRLRIVPGQPAASEVWRRILGHGRPRMPFDGPPWLEAGDVQLIGRWIADGARDSNAQPAPLPVGARLRLRGVMSADGSLDGLVLPAGGRRDKRPSPGEPVELRGTIGAGGQIEVERLRRR
jgi:mono/diheme cytochrome c family protein